MTGKIGLNNDCSAEDRLRELKLISLEQSKSGDSKYVFKMYLAYL
jgi:hypothetical protein